MIDFEDYRDLFNKYDTLTKISFDYAVVEKESSIQVLRYSGDWKDVGTWNMMAEVMADKTKGKAILDETCENTNVVNELNIPILCMGCKDMIVAASGDGILIADKERSGYMKPYVEKIETEAMYISNRTILNICEIVEKYSIKLVFIEDSVFGGLVKAIKEKFSDVKIISFYHDMGADLFVQWSKRENWMGKIECKLSIYQEKLNQKYCDVNIVFNQRDAQLYQKYYGEMPDAIIPISTPTPEIDWEKAAWSNEKSDIMQVLFVGSKYYPNIVGIKWFYKNVLPKLNNNIIINIVGRGTEILKKELTDCRIRIYGSVDSLAPYYMGADVIIAPLFDGGGMKTKTVEALSYGKSIVATDEGLEGFWQEMDSTIKQRKFVSSMLVALRTLQTSARSWTASV